MRHAARVTALMADAHQHFLNEECSLFPWLAQYTNRS